MVYVPRRIADIRDDHLLAIGLKRQAIIRIAKELPEGQGRAATRQIPPIQTAHVLVIAQIVNARKLQRITQAALAAQAGTSQTTIARIERGQTTPTLALLLKIISALGLQLKLQ